MDRHSHLLSHAANMAQSQNHNEVCVVQSGVIVLGPSHLCSSPKSFSSHLVQVSSHFLGLSHRSLVKGTVCRIVKIQDLKIEQI